MAFVPSQPVSTFAGETSRYSFPLLSANGGVIYGTLNSKTDPRDYFVVDIAGGTRDSSGSLGSNDSLVLSYSFSGNNGTKVAIEVDPQSYSSLEANGNLADFSPVYQSESGTRTLQSYNWTRPSLADALAFGVSIYSLSDVTVSYVIGLQRVTNEGTGSSGGAGGSGTGSGGTGSGGAGAGNGVDYSTSATVGAADYAVERNGLRNANISITNSGNRAGNPGTIGYYISTDQNIDRSDRLLLENYYLQDIAPGGRSSFGITFQVPMDLPDGTYYFGVIADNSQKIPEISETNNASAAVPFIIKGGLLTGTAGSDNLTGTLNNDFIQLLGGDDTYYGAAGNDAIFGNQGDDFLFGNLGDDTIYGGQGKDTLYGGQGVDSLFGNIGDDVISGNLGADILFGGQGNDTLYGGQANDILSGDLGDDVLSGDLGADRYVFGQNSGNDIILGFSQVEGDRIDLQGQSYTISSSADGAARLVLSGGGAIELSGIYISYFGSGVGYFA